MELRAKKSNALLIEYRLERSGQNGRGVGSLSAISSEAAFLASRDERLIRKLALRWGTPESLEVLIAPRSATCYSPPAHVPQRDQGGTNE
jgi:hypothetical protein